MSQFDIEILKGGYAMELDPDPEGWIAVATRPFRDGTAKQASIWTAFAIMAIASLISLRKIPWTQQTKRRFHVLPFLALLRATLCYLFIAMQYSFKTHCKTYHLASSRDNGEPDDWQPGAVPGLPRLEMCHANAGLDAFSRRVILILWISELVAYTGNSLSFGFSAFGIITILDRWGSSGSERWEMIANVWQWVAGAGCLAWTVYKMGWRRNAQARKFFEKLVACLIALYAAHGLVGLWAQRLFFPSDLEHIACAIIDTLLNAGISSWLLNTNIPPPITEQEEAQQVGVQETEAYTLSQIVLVAYMVQVAVWYQGQSSK